MSEAISEPRGLIGIASGLGGTAARAAGKTFSFIANPERWALYLVLFAGVITVLKKNYTDDWLSYAMWFGTALGLAALMYEMIASRKLVRAYWDGCLGRMVWCAALWAVAFGFSINNWVGAAAENQAEKTNLHRTAFLATKDVRGQVSALESQLEKKNAQIDWSQALKAPEAYEGLISAAQADADYEATRGGCKSKCIAKQQLVASLQAERANAIERATVMEEIKVLTKKLEDARKVASVTKVETSQERNDLLILTKYAGMTEESAQIFNGLLSIVVVSILLSFGSMYAELEELRHQGKRTAFGFWGRIRGWYYRVMHGKAPPATSTNTVTNNIMTDRASAIATIAAFEKRYGPLAGAPA